MRCKPGDLAIGSDGGLCEILEWVGIRPNNPFKDLWRVRLLSGVQGAQTVTLNGMPVGLETLRFQPGETCYAPDAFLTPLKGDPNEALRETETPIKELTP